MKTALKIALIASPIVIGGIIIFQQASAAKKKKLLNTPPSSDPPASTTQSVQQIVQQVQSTGCTYPLKVGSKNTCVGQLQAALGIHVDNAFGSKETLPALQAATGKTEIKDANELAQVLLQLQQKSTTDAVTKARQDRAALIARDFAALGNTVANWYMLNATTFYKVVFNYGAYTKTGTTLSKSKGEKLNTADYKLYDTTKLGYLIIQVTKGTLAGLYTVNPMDVLIQR